MDNVIDYLQIDDLIGEQREIAEAIGLDAYKKLVTLCGGSYIYLPKRESYTRQIRDRVIRSEYTGTNANKLARKYGLSVGRIRKIVR